MPTDQYAQFTLTTSGTTGDAGVMVRAQPGAQSGYWLDITTNGGNTVKVYKIVAGALTLLTQTSSTTTTGTVWQFDIQGSALKVYRNTVLIPALNVTDTTFATGQPGINAFSNTGQNSGGTWSAGTP